MAGVERTELAPGLEISRILTGLWQIADMERHGSSVDLDDAAREMGRYVQAGLTTFDMADHYGSSELIAGRFSAESPGTAELFTKWVPKPGAGTREGVRVAIDLALERMQATRLDLLQFHAWSYADPGWLDCIFLLQELREEGLIGHLALTNTDTAHLRMLLDSGVEIVSNQVCYSLLDQRARGGMTELCLAPDGRTHVLSGTIWEDLAGFGRAVRKGRRILVSGTTATHRDRLIGWSSAKSQTHFCIDKIEGALQSLGGSLEDLVRTRIYIRNAEAAEAVSLAHGARLGHIQPANTLVQAGLIGDGYLVEMEAEAVVTGAD